MGLFGPSKDEVWGQVSQEIGGRFIPAGLWKSSRVESEVGPWTIVLDTYRRSQGKTSQVYTRMKVPYVNPGQLRFKVYRKGIFSELGKFLGMQNIDVGDFEFDGAFIVKGNDEGKIRELFSNANLRSLYLAQPKLKLEVWDNDCWLTSRLPRDVDKLQFQVRGVIKDVNRLKGLFALFVGTLDQLCRIGGAQKQSPGVSL